MKKKSHPNRGAFVLEKPSMSDACIPLPEGQTSGCLRLFLINEKEIAPQQGCFCFDRSSGDGLTNMPAFQVFWERKGFKSDWGTLWEDRRKIVRQPHKKTREGLYPATDRRVRMNIRAWRGTFRQCFLTLMRCMKKALRFRMREAYEKTEDADRKEFFKRLGFYALPSSENP